MCCDFPNLNAQTVKDAFPFPRVDECIARLGNAKFFTCLDLAAAFWQIPTKRGDEPKTDFACELGLFHWKRMPFGLCNAPATFQRAITKILQKVLQRYGNLVMCYIDDVVIATATAEDNVQRLREVLTCFRDAGLKLKPTKCEIMKDCVKYLGRVVDETGVYPDPDQTAVIEARETPRNSREVQSFLGLANYYRELVINYTAKAKSLTKLTKANRTSKWGLEAQQAFEQLKKEL